MIQSFLTLVLNFLQYDFVRDYLICCFGFIFLPPMSTAKESRYANLACYLYVLTGGLIQFTFIWTWLDETCTSICDTNCMDTIFDGATLNMASYIRLFAKDGFSDACKEHSLPCPKDYDPDNLPQNEKVWAKPKRGGCGRGHFIYNTQNVFPGNLDDWVLQEILKPSSNLMKLLAHEHLATFRVQSIAPAGSDPVCIPPYILRVGPPGSICDNDNSKPGRSLIYVDADGNVTKAVSWPQNEELMILPSGLEVEGLTIPEFSRVVPIIQKAHAEICPNAFNLGWDVALTSKGLRIIEVNYCSPVLQYFLPEVWREMQTKKLNHLFHLLVSRFMPARFSQNLRKALQSKSTLPTSSNVTRILTN